MSKILLNLSDEPPEVNSKIVQEIYDIVKTEEFSVEKFNSLLLAVVTYLDKHGFAEYQDKQLPWAREVENH